MRHFYIYIYIQGDQDFAYENGGYYIIIIYYSLLMLSIQFLLHEILYTACTIKMVVNDIIILQLFRSSRRLKQ